jgi:signal transduction histidine kinase
MGSNFRERLHEEQGLPAEESKSFRPRGRENDVFIPIEPVLDFTFRLERNDKDEGKPPETVLRVHPGGDTPARRAGARMTNTLRERAEYIAAFAANVSHELKTPLTAIRGAAELLAEQSGAMTDAKKGRKPVPVEALSR